MADEGTGAKAKSRRRSSSRHEAGAAALVAGAGPASGDSTGGGSTGGKAKKNKEKSKDKAEKGDKSSKAAGGRTMEFSLTRDREGDQPGVLQPNTGGMTPRARADPPPATPAPWPAPGQERLATPPPRSRSRGLAASTGGAPASPASSAAASPFASPLAHGSAVAAAPAPPASLVAPSSSARMTNELLCQPLELRYDAVRAAALFLPDGSGTVFYPSGNIAVCVARDRTRGATTLVYADSATPAAVLASFSGRGLGSLCYQSGGDRSTRVRMALSGGGVTTYTPRGDVEARLAWPAGGGALASPLEAQLNGNVLVVVHSLACVVVSFRAETSFVDLNAGTAPPARPPSYLARTVGRADEGSLRGKRVLDIAATPLARLAAPRGRSPSPVGASVMPTPARSSPASRLARSLGRELGGASPLRRTRASPPGARAQAPTTRVQQLRGREIDSFVAAAPRDVCVVIACLAHTSDAAARKIDAALAALHRRQVESLGAATWLPALVDCTQHALLAERHGMTQYPTFLVYLAGKLALADTTLGGEAEVGSAGIARAVEEAQRVRAANAFLAPTHQMPVAPQLLRMREAEAALAALLQTTRSRVKALPEGAAAARRSPSPLTPAFK